MAKIRQKTEASFSPEALSVLDFQPAISPRFERADHLAQLADVFARSEREEVNVLLSLPPQHGKTEFLLHGCAWRLKRDPTLPIFYASFSAQVAHAKSRLMRDYARRAGVDSAGLASNCVRLT